MPNWQEPTHNQAAHVTSLLASRKVVFRHVLPTGARVEVAHVGTRKLTWLVVWSGSVDETWPDTCPEWSLMRAQLDDVRQQTWAFLGDNEYGWETLLREAWGLSPDIRSGSLA